MKKKNKMKKTTTIIKQVIRKMMKRQILKGTLKSVNPIKKMGENSGT